MGSGRTFQYNPGDIISHYKMLSRDYTTGGGNWFCTFECLQCREVFQARLKNITRGAQPCNCKKSNRADLIGKTKGVYTIIDEAPSRSNNRNAYWKCQCKCGKIFEISTTDFNRREHAFCPHQESNLNTGRPPKDLVGKTFDKLTVLDYVGNQRWKCQCTCGQEVIKRTDVLTTRPYNSCSSCSSINNSHGERRITEILNKLNIKFESQKSFETCRFPNTGAKARFDFYIPSMNILIEYNGEQHYKSNGRGWNTEEALVDRQERDQYKIAWCNENNIPLMIIPYTDFDIIDEDYIIDLLGL